MQEIREAARIIFADVVSKLATVGSMPYAVLALDNYGNIIATLDLEDLPKEQRAHVMEHVAQRCPAAFCLFEAWVATAASREEITGQVRDHPNKRDALVGMLLFSDGQLVNFMQLLDSNRRPEGESTESVADSVNRSEGVLVPTHKSVERA